MVELAQSLFVPYALVVAAVLVAPVRVSVPDAVAVTRVVLAAMLCHNLF